MKEKKIILKIFSSWYSEKFCNNCIIPAPFCEHDRVLP